VSQQETGTSTIDPMSQKATTDALNLKFDKASVLQVSGAATDKVMSQKAVTDALKTLSDDFNNKLTNYLPLAGGTMKGSIRFPIGNGIACNDVAGTAAYVVLRTWNANNSTRMYVGTVNFPTYISSTASDLIHDRNGSSYLLWDSYNLPTPASTTDLANYLPLIGGTLTGQLTIKQSVDIKLRLQSTDADNHCIIQAINAQASQLGVFGYAGDKWVIGHNGTYYEIWDKYNLTNPVTYTTNTYNHATLTNKDGQYFTYIKAGTNGLLPHSKVALASGGSGLLGTSDQSFNAAYINNLHTNKVTFGDAGSFIDNQSGDSDHIGIGFYTSQRAACPVYVGSLCVSDSYANGVPNIPTNGIYSKGVIKSAAGFTSNSRQTNLNLAKTGNDVLYISSFVGGSTGSPGTDSNTGRTIDDGMFLTYFWQNDNAFQLVADIDGTGIAYRHYIPSTGNSTTGWKFLADTDWVVSKINSSTSNFLKKTGDTATGQIILDSKGIAFKANTWTNDLAPNRNYGGYLQVLDAYDASSAGGPTNHGTVLQVNSRNAHWANQLWFPGGAEASKNLYYRHMAYNETTYGEWHRLLTNKDVNILSTSYNNNPNSLPTNQIFYAETHGVAGTPTSNGLLFSVQGDDEGIQLWASANRTALYYRTKWTSFGNWIKLATTSDIGNYLPLTGGTLSGTLTINTVGSTTLVINNNDTNGSETFMRVLRKGTASAAIGFRDSLGAYIYNYNSNKYLFIDNDGYARVGTTNGSTKLALITDIPIVSGYLPLSGGTMSGNISFNGDTGHIVVDARETSNFVSAVSFNKGSATNSAYIGYHSTGGSDSSGALVLVPYPTSANPWDKAVGLYIAKNELSLDGKAIATQEYVTWNNVAGKPTIYERTIGINGTYWSFYAPTNATSAMIYGPTSAGTSGQILQSTGGVPKWVNASSVVGNFVSKSGDTMTGALTMNSRRNNIVVDVVGGAGNSWDEGAGALSVQVPSDSGQTPLLLARRSGATINTTTLSERLLDMALLDTGTIFRVGMSGVNALELEVTSFTNKVGIGKLFGKQIATTDKIPSIPSISISNSGSGNAVTSITASGHTLTVTKGATYLTSHQTIYDLTFQAGTFAAKTFDPNGAAATVNIPTSTSHLTNDSGFITSSALSGYATQTWAKGQFAPLSRFNTGTGYTTIKVTGQEFNFDSTSPEIYMNYRTLSGSPAVTKITWKAGGGPSSTALCEGRWGNLYMNDNLVATQSWVNSQNFVKSTSTKKVTDIQPVDVLPATQASGVLYLVFG
jgi:hypothetical protein